MERRYIRNAVQVKKVGDTLTILSDGPGVLDEKTVIAEGTDTPRPLKDWMGDVVSIQKTAASIYEQIKNFYSYVDPKGAPGRFDEETGELIPFNSSVNVLIANGLKPEDLQYAWDKSPDIPYIKQVIAIGPSVMNSAMKRQVYLSDNIGIGSRIMSTAGMSSAAQHNIGIGDAALWNLTTGDRNIGIGSTALAGLKDGRCNIAIGRDTGWGLESGEYNTFLGVHLLGGYAPITLDGTEHNLFPYTANKVTAVGGGHSLSRISRTSDNAVVVGSYIFPNAKRISNTVAIGSNIAEHFGENQSPRGKGVVIVNHTATYSVAGNSITVTCAGHSAVVGCYVRLAFLDGPIKSETQWLVCSSSNGSAFTLTIPYQVSYTGTGNCEVYLYEQSNDVSIWDTENVFIGASVVTNITSSRNSTVIGSRAAQSVRTLDQSDIIGRLAVQTAETVTASVVVGSYSCEVTTKIENAVVIGKSANAKTAVGTVILGNGAGSRDSSIEYSTIVGRNAGGCAGTHKLSTSVALGHGALDIMQDGAVSTSDIGNCIGIGRQSRVSGSNQCQLGDSNVTTYAYGAVQNRSDARDKADIRDTVLGLDFIAALRPVDFRWDYRDDYVDTVEQEDGTVETVIHERDGSRKRARFHHGFIAQEVKAVMDEQGTDFGGYQDHKINGGCDVLSIGYEELIAPIVKSIQTLNTRLMALEAK